MENGAPSRWQSVLNSQQLMEFKASQGRWRKDRTSESCLKPRTVVDPMEMGSLSYSCAQIHRKPR